MFSVVSVILSARRRGLFLSHDVLGTYPIMHHHHTPLRGDPSIISSVRFKGGSRDAALLGKISLFLCSFTEKNWSTNLLTPL